MKTNNLSKLFSLVNDSSDLKVVKKITNNFDKGLKTKVCVVGNDNIERRVDVFFMTESSMVNINDDGVVDIYYYDKIKKLKLPNLEAV